MSETGNIEELAKKVSKDIFKWFKWEACPLKDIDWDCVTEHHCKKTHPADVVYYYDDPYSGKKVYLNTDLKSYKKGSITNQSVNNALKSLAMSIECANVSSDWQSKFLLDDADYSKVIGLLFIYNHDNEFDKDSQEIINAVDYKKVNMPESVMLSIFAPDTIRRLLNIVTDIKGLIAEELFPRHEYTFYYHDLVMSRRYGDEWDQPATLEALTAPWLIIKHKDAGEIEEGYLIYYHGEGATVEEFIYLIDALSHYQMLLSNMPIRIRFTDACRSAPNNFHKAKGEYLKMWGADESREKRLNTLKAERIDKVVSNYCPMEIGMREDG
ncbi:MULTISPECIES: hypothetical protein [unclassified Endozoicomonas]|uniref:hypothetical protein n=1 Tax=unclassified Endozoicomonas TaxID=2644528 RepID=UPI003BB59542